MNDSNDRDEDGEGLTLEEKIDLLLSETQLNGAALKSLLSNFPTRPREARARENCRS